MHWKIMLNIVEVEVEATFDDTWKRLRSVSKGHTSCEFPSQPSERKRFHANLPKSRLIFLKVLYLSKMFATQPYYSRKYLRKRIVDSALLIISWRSWKSRTVGSPLYETTKSLVLARRRKQYSSFSVPNRGILPEPYYPCEKFTVSKSTTIRLFRTRSIVLYIRRVSPGIHISTRPPPPSRESPDRVLYRSAISSNDLACLSADP